MTLHLLRKSQLALICLVITAVVLGAAVLADYHVHGFGWLVRSELRARAFLVRHGVRNPADPQLVFLGIDNDSVMIEQVDLDQLFADVPRESSDFRALSLISRQWPWPREIYALMLDKLFAAGARVVVFDLLFPKASGDERDDLAFRAALDRYRGRVIIGSNFVEQTVAAGAGGSVHALPSASLIPQTAPLDSRTAPVNFWPDEVDGCVWRARFRITAQKLQEFPSTPDSEVFLSLAARAVSLAGHGDHVPLGTDVDWLFRYTAPGGEGFRPHSVYELFVPRFWQANFGGGERLRDKIVLIGPSGNWTHDEHETPYGTMPGPELHLNALNALLHQAFLTEMPPWSSRLLIVLSGALAWAASLFSPRPPLQILRIMLVNVTGFFVGMGAYNYLDLFVTAAASFLAFNLSAGACFVYEFIVERFDKARTRRTLERYVSKDVVRELLDNRQSLLHTLGGTRRTITVLFSDLRGFTSLTESADAVALVTQLNEYFHYMVRAVFAHAGTLDKFIGDGLMAHWGSIVSEGETADACQAVRTALHMRAALATLNPDWKARGLPVLEFGIGINSGEAIVGNIGCDEKMEVSVIGDPVNLAARIESATKEYRVDLLIGEGVARLIGETFILRSVDQLRVIGKSRAVEVYTVLAERTADTVTPEWLVLYERAIGHYRGREFAEAIQLCDQAAALQPDDWLIKEYRRRAEVYLIQPPSADWSGVRVLSKK